MEFSDVTGIESSASFDVVEYDKKCRRLINKTTEVLRATNIYHPDVADLIDGLLKQFLITHVSIRVLIAESVEARSARVNPTREKVASDAMSFAREQIEKLFLICYLIDKGEPVVIDFNKNLWAKLVSLKAFDFAQTTHLEKYKQAEEKTFEHLDIMRRQLGISLEVFSKLKQGEGVRNFKLPLPTEILDKTSDPNIKILLNYWIKYYYWYSAYNHSHLLKLYISKASQEFDLRSYRMANDEQNGLITASYSCIACACTELIGPKIKNVEWSCLAYDFWEDLKKSSCWSQATWSIRAKELLPKLI